MEDHMKKTMLALFVVGLVVVLIPAFAQKDNPFVGTWEVISSTRDGKEVFTPLPAGVQPGITHFIYSPDGFYMWLVVPRNRPQPSNPANEQTKEDWQNHFQGVTATYGIYSVSKDKITRKTLISTQVAQNPGTDSVWTFHKDGQDIVMNITRLNGTKEEARIRRAK
jgi:hypothetical protein